MRRDRFLVPGMRNRNHAPVLWEASSPVSYTHLDVYKRQTYSNREAEIVSEALEWALRETIALFLVAPECRTSNVCPVSYTHLTLLITTCWVVALTGSLILRRLILRFVFKF